MTVLKTRNPRRDLVFFLLVIAALGMASGLWETSFNNFLSDTFHLSARTRGNLEFPRELPGFLVTALGGALFFLSEVRLGVFATLALGAGFIGVAMLGQQWGSMVAFMFLWSVGNHMMMPVSNTINLSLAPAGKRAASMGRVAAMGAAAAILGAAVVSVGKRYFHVSYQFLFVTAGCCALLAAVFISRIQPLPHRAEQRPKLVLKRRYSLYYLLCVFSGARKQVFVTFGPWVLIKLFGEPASTIANLWIIASAIGIFFQPQVGRLIDRFGERTVLRVDAVLLCAVCLGYGFAWRLPVAHPVHIVYACYVLDNVLFACSMARTTYVDKIAENQSDIHATLSIGVSIDHAVSMSVPAAAGWLWAIHGGNSGYPYVFLAAASVAVLNFIAYSFIRTPKGHPVGVAQTEAEDVLVR